MVRRALGYVAFGTVLNLLSKRLHLVAGERIWTVFTATPKVQLAAN